jgi:hypothetical protein
MRFQIAIFKNAIPKRFIFCDLVKNRTYCLRNRNSKRTLSCKRHPFKVLNPIILNAKNCVFKNTFLKIDNFKSSVRVQ